MCFAVIVIFNFAFRDLAIRFFLDNDARFDFEARYTYANALDRTGGSHRNFDFENTASVVY